MKAVNESIKIVNGGASEDENGEDESEEQWNGLSEDAVDNGQDEEYVDEDQYATVTVEAVDITRDGFVAHGNSDEEDEEDDDGETMEKTRDGAEKAKLGTEATGQSKKKLWTKNRPVSDKSKRKKKRNFKYEGKEDRKLNRARERSKHKAQASARKSRS